MYEQRRAKVFAWLEENGIDMAYITADANVRYLTGMPNGSVLFLFRKAKAILVPWDAILAGKIAECEEVIPYTDFDRDIHTAAASLAGREQLAGGATIDVPGDIGHLKFTTLEKKLDAYRLRCSEDGTNDFVLKLRMVKDPSETAVLRRACVMTDALIEEIIAGVDSGSLHTETDVALFMERESRKRGAEGMGFDTIAAGPARSFAASFFSASSSKETLPVDQLYDTALRKSRRMRCPKSTAWRQAPPTGSGRRRVDVCASGGTGWR